MENRIRLLDEATINQIAAGEVVERPASVVKELIENALDAGSTRVEIELEAGGLSLLRVVDNGWGMHPEELPLAIERHATSKIACVQDLNEIQSFGFRGEALASLAAVSKLEIISRAPNSEIGTRLVVEGGQVKSVEPIGAPLGTQVTSRDLFYNLPARKKFIKSENGELRQIIFVVSRLALGNPQIAFHLRTSERTLVQTNGSKEILEVISRVYGFDVAERMLPLEPLTISFVPGQKSPVLRVSGFISQPSLTRSNRQLQSFYVNQRFIQSSVLQAAVLEGYRNLIPNKRFPVVVLNLEIAAPEIDVNVHPSKSEVRFSQEDKVFSGITQAIQRTLHTKQVIPSIQQRTQTLKSPEISDTRIFPGAAPDEHPPFSHSVDLSSKEDIPRQEVAETLAPYAQKAETSPAQFGTENLPLDRNINEEKWENVDFEAGKSKLPLMYPKAQLASMYIVAEGPEGLFILDQHAAHERILYEKIMREMESGQNYSQAVLFPETVEVSPEEMEQFTQHVLTLRNLGFVLEHFGGNAFILRGIPTFIQGSGKVAFLDLLDFLKERSGVNTDQLYAGIAARLACKHATKAADTLSQSEMESLIQQMTELENPFACPHGRPTILQLTPGELARHFQRQ